MGISRTNHAATLLPSSKVLVVGGQGDHVNRPPGSKPHPNDSIVNTPEIYDPSLASWSNGEAQEFLGRFYLTATVLRTGRVLIAGGTVRENGQPGIKSAYTYDPASDRWEQSGDMAIGRSHHTATLLKDGRVLVAGGFQAGEGPLYSAEIFNPKTNRWREAGSMSINRFAHSASALPNGNVLVTGGINREVKTKDGRGAEFLRSAEIFDPKKGTWRKIELMRTGHAAHTSTTLRNGEVIVAEIDAGLDPVGSAELSPEKLRSGPLSSKALMTLTLLLGSAVVLALVSWRLISKGQDPEGLSSPGDPHQPK